jgi:hypothetical protein
VKHVSPLAGQWQCATCSRTFGRHFMQCAYCPFGNQTQQSAPHAPKRAAQVGRPTGGVTGRVWAILDGLGSSAALPELLRISALEKINDSTARTQFSRWRKVSRSP